MSEYHIEIYNHGIGWLLLRLFLCFLFLQLKWTNNGRVKLCLETNIPLKQISTKQSMKKLHIIIWFPVLLPMQCWKTNLNNVVVDISTQQFCKKSSNTSEKQFYNGWFLPRNSTTIGELDWNWEKRKKSNWIMVWIEVSR